MSASQTEFRAIERGRISSGKIVEIDGDVPVGMKIKLGDFAEAISTRIWDSVGRASCRNFEDALAFVRRLGLRTQSEWNEYCASGEKPADIPSSPEYMYAEAGWTNWGDWLGTGRVATHLRSYRPFKDARVHAPSLGLKSANEWRDYSMSGKKPDDIPGAPRLVYAKAGWAGYGDWLNTGRRVGGWRDFKKARAFVQGLGLKSQDEWFDYCKSGKKPADIPSNPGVIYADAGWSGFGDWLDTGRRRGGWRDFKKARAFVRRLGLKSRSEWTEYCGSGKKPADIPSSPEYMYGETGWCGWGDWLGTGRVATHLRRYRPFKDARVYARRLRFKSSEEWLVYCKSGKKPADIPSNPNHVYANDRWAGYGDWLGTGRVRGATWRPFKKARSFACHLGLRSWAEWNDYCKSGKKPADIPSNPDKAYQKRVGPARGLARHGEGCHAIATIPILQ